MNTCKKVLSLIIFIFLVMDTSPSFGQSGKTASVISGTVTDKSGAPLELVNLHIRGTSIGDVSDAKGAFSIRTGKTGTFTLIASLVGYKDEEVRINLAPGSRIQQSITLHETNTELSEIEVTASSFTTGEAKGVTLNPLEVVTTPGAQADLFRTIKTFPGVSTVDQGAGLFVRGGDVSETKILLDQATVVHPYRFESPTGGARGTIPPFLVSGTYFSSGGFPARYGDALSAVLAIESQNRPRVASVDLNLSMAAASAGFSIPLVDDKLGIRFSGNRSSTQFLFEVNGQADEFDKAPEGLNGNLSLIYQPSENTTLKFFNYASHSKIGVRTSDPSFDGLFNSDATNRLHNLQWQQFWGEWLMKTSISVNRFDSKRSLGGFNLTQGDDTYKIRTDVERPFPNGLQLLFGGEWASARNSFTGSVPDHEQVYNPDADFTSLDESYTGGRLATWAEIEFGISPNIRANIGLRSDVSTKTRQAVADPRFTLRYQIGKHTTLRAATGRYHQFAEPFQLNPATGNPALKARQAWHYILGLEYQKELLHLRVEGYYKNYDDLIIDDNTTNLSNRGYGSARGVDVFIKYSEYLKTQFNGWISYSFLRSDRLQAQDLGDRFTFREAPSDFDITHNLNVVGKMRIIDNFYFGAGYRFATGRPVTPVADAKFVESAGFYQPVEGPVNSQRLPDFRRLDLDLSYFWPFGSGKAAIFYVSVSNALDHDNITGYSYNKDYSQRRPAVSSYSRAVYAGVSVQL